MTHTTEPCMFCHQASTITLTAQEARDWQAGTPIQDAMRDRPTDERELSRSGSHPECWTGVFGLPD